MKTVTILALLFNLSTTFIPEAKSSHTTDESERPFVQQLKRIFQEEANKVFIYSIQNTGVVKTGGALGPVQQLGLDRTNGIRYVTFAETYYAQAAIIDGQLYHMADEHTDHGGSFFGRASPRYDGQSVLIDELPGFYERVSERIMKNEALRTDFGPSQRMKVKTVSNWIRSHYDEQLRYLNVAKNTSDNEFISILSTLLRLDSRTNYRQPNGLTEFEQLKYLVLKNHDPLYQGVSAYSVNGYAMDFILEVRSKSQSDLVFDEAIRSIDQEYSQKFKKLLDSKHVKAALNKRGHPFLKIRNPGCVSLLQSKPVGR